MNYSERPSRRVLVVDDNRDIRELITFILSDSGYQPLSAADGESALALIHREEVSLLLLDVMMPGKSGHQILAEIRNSPDAAISQLPIIIISAKSQSADLERAISLGADGYIIKPFKAGELISEIDRLLSDARAAR